jgi:hypothetical protein
MRHGEDCGSEEQPKDGKVKLPHGSIMPYRRRAVTVADRHLTRFMGGLSRIL